MRVLDIEQLNFVCGGDSWAGTPEGRTTTDGKPAGSTGENEACYRTDYYLNGRQAEICVITRSTSR
jgi:hypothetical protein